MHIEASYARKIGIAERELGDKLFLLLWVATVIQLGLILFEWINLVPSLNNLIQFSWADEIKAIELSTTGYLVIQLAYMGKKEITRWVRRSDTALNPDEYIRRIRKGDNAVLIWGVLYLAAILCVALHFIEQMPAELSRTFIQVTTLYTCAFVSKAAFKGRMKQTTATNHGTAAESDGTLSAHTGDEMTEKEQELLGFIREHKTVNRKDCIGHTNFSRSTVNRLLKNLLDSDMIVRDGTNRNATYSMNGRADQSRLRNVPEEK